MFLIYVSIPEMHIGLYDTQLLRVYVFKPCCGAWAEHDNMRCNNSKVLIWYSFRCEPCSSKWWRKQIIGPLMIINAWSPTHQHHPLLFPCIIWCAVCMCACVWYSVWSFLVYSVSHVFSSRGLFGWPPDPSFSEDSQLRTKQHIKEWGGTARPLGFWQNHLNK